MNVPSRIRQFGFIVLLGQSGQKLRVVIHGARNHIKMQALCFARLLIHEQRQAFRVGIVQPFFYRQAIALGFGNFCSGRVKKQLIVKAFRRHTAQRLYDFRRQLDRINQILTGHFIVNIQRIPAHGPIRLPLQFGLAARNQRVEHFACGRVGPADKPGFGVKNLHRHLHHHTGFRVQRQKRRVAGRAFFAECGQHNRHHLTIALQHA